MKRNRLGRILSVLSFCLPVVGWASPVKIGSEFQVNSYTTYHQRHPSIAASAAGDFVVVWESYVQDGSGSGIFGRRFDGAGTPLGSEFQVNTYTTSYQTFPSVAMNSAGDFIVVWESVPQDGSGSGIFARRFDSAGTPLGSEFQVNSYTPRDQYDPSVAMNAAGDFVVVWNSDRQDGSYVGVFARRFDSAGAPRGSEFQVNTYTTSYQFAPSIAVNSAGGFVVTWSSFGQDGSYLGVFARRFDSAGIPRGSEFQVNTETMFFQSQPAIAMNTQGDFVVAWSSPGQDGSNEGVFGQRFDRAGIPRGSEFQVNVYTTSGQHSPSISFDAAGNFVVAWISYAQDGSRGGVFGRRFDGAGAPRGSEFQVNTYTTGYQWSPVIAGSAAGDFVVAWTSYYQDGSGAGTFGQRFGLGPLVINPFAGDALDCSDPLVSRPPITWETDGYDRFRVLFSTDPGFPKGSVVSSGDTLLRTTSYTPPAKKWRKACKMAVAANPAAPKLYIEVFGVDHGLSKRDPERKHTSPPVQVDVIP